MDIISNKHYGCYQEIRLILNSNNNITTFFTFQNLVPHHFKELCIPIILLVQVTKLYEIAGLFLNAIWALLRGAGSGFSTYTARIITGIYPARHYIAGEGAGTMLLLPGDIRKLLRPTCYMRYRCSAPKSRTYQADEKTLSSEQGCGNVPLICLVHHLAWVEER